MAILNADYFQVVETKPGECCVTRKSTATGIMHSINLPVPAEKIEAWRLQNRGALVQEIFPELDNGQREFLLTGITDAEWDEMFREEDDDATL